jgi:hypothetical protein
MPAADLITILEISHLPMISISSNSYHRGLPVAIALAFHKSAIVRSDLQRAFTRCTARRCLIRQERFFVLKENSLIFASSDATSAATLVTCKRRCLLLPRNKQQQPSHSVSPPVS